uniref:Uncharacterized protein n=1 Tax=Amphimedon queenslandica TaxID=400682 RepID=A0A1X7U822_AMPQE
MNVDQYLSIRKPVGVHDPTHTGSPCLQLFREVLSQWVLKTQSKHATSFRKTREVPHNVEDTIGVFCHCNWKVAKVEEDLAVWSKLTDLVYPFLEELAHVIDSELCAPFAVAVCKVKLEEIV